MYYFFNDTATTEIYPLSLHDALPISPPIGSMMAYDPVTNRWDLGLRARGIVLLGAGEPIVLCAFDWIGMANEGHDAFQAALRSEEHTSELQSPCNLVCRLLLEKKKRY